MSTFDPSHEPEARNAATRAAESATRRIAPLWPLRHFVAVNPFLGLTDHDFASAARAMGLAAGARMTAPRACFAEAIRNGRITRADLAAALAQCGSLPGAPATVEALEAFAREDAEPADLAPAPTVADVARDRTGRDWGRLATQCISTWAASHFDEGQALWRSPWRELSPWTAWRAEAAIDRTPELSGVRGFRRCVTQLPEEAGPATAHLIARLGVPMAGLETYLHRLLMTIGGWASYARYRVWESELHGTSSSVLVELLAIRLAWELALLEAFSEAGVAEAWRVRREELAQPVVSTRTEAALAAEIALQTALEAAVQRELVGKMSRAARRPVAVELAPGACDGRKAVQAVFCIDVRSEVFRRALESTAPEVETLGFAGFFGIPIEYVPLGAERGSAQCPVLLTPRFVVEEAVRGADAAEQETLGRLRALRRRSANAWRAFKFGAVSCFGFVGPVGLAYAPKLLSDALGRTRPVPPPSEYGLDAAVRARLAPRLEPGERSGRATGIPAEERLALAEGVLRAMSLTDGFARLVVLVGHGSTTVNNPHATGLDCGACGGHTGEAAARVAAAVLQDAGVRQGLAARGIALPEDTVFVAAQHDTTTDEVTIFDEALVPATHAEALAELKRWLRAAGGIARTERCRLLNVDPGTPVDDAIRARSRDWSQVRPEWGLAGCAAFIAAPRHRTRHLDLGGRAFLHSYDWKRDEGFGVLELVMTAPMVVASWISLQYYGSTVDNRVFGSGNKTLHNVVGALGVLEGNGGDLRPGLPWQSVHDGERFVHEPVRLNVLIEAPVDAMSRVLEKHPEVRALADNGWVHLFALDEGGSVSQRYVGNLTWRPVGVDA